MVETKKCAHQSCRCLVEDGKIYCSQWCEDAKHHIEAITCECAHPACEEKMSERD